MPKKLIEPKRFLISKFRFFEVQSAIGDDLTVQDQCRGILYSEPLYTFICNGLENVALAMKKPLRCGSPIEPYKIYSHHNQDGTAYLFNFLSVLR
jgi:hypothetical protein